MGQAKVKVINRCRLCLERHNNVELTDNNVEQG